MDLWFHPNEIIRQYQRAHQLLEACVQTGAVPFPREHECFACDRDLRLMCISWAGQAIEAVGPAQHYTSYLYDSETGQACGPDEFLDSQAGRAGVWTSRLVAAVGNRDLELVAALTAPELPELDIRAESLLRGAAHLTSERLRYEELKEIERQVLAEVGEGLRQSVQRWQVPPVPPIPWREWGRGFNPEG